MPFCLRNLLPLLIDACASLLMGSEPLSTVESCSIKRRDELNRFVAEKRSLSVLKVEGCTNLGFLNISSSSLSTLWLSDLFCISRSVVHCPNLKELSLEFTGHVRKMHIASARLCNDAVRALADADIRPRHLQHILELGYSVMYNDVDMVWLADPFPYLKGHHDVYFTDDMAAVKPLNHSHSLPHPGKKGRTYICSCMIFLRPSNGAKLVMKKGIEELQLQPWSKKARSNDQPAFNWALNKTADQVHGNCVGGRIINGSSPAELIERYTETIGRTPVLPNWIISGAVIGMQGGTGAVRTVWDQLNDHDVPMSAFWL